METDTKKHILTVDGVKHCGTLYDLYCEVSDHTVPYEVLISYIENGMSVKDAMLLSTKKSSSPKYQFTHNGVLYQGSINSILHQLPDSDFKPGYDTVYHRLLSGIPVKDAFLTPVHIKNKNVVLTLSYKGDTFTGNLSQISKHFKVSYNSLRRYNNRGLLNNDTLAKIIESSKDGPYFFTYKGKRYQKVSGYFVSSFTGYDQKLIQYGLSLVDDTDISSIIEHLIDTKDYVIKYKCPDNTVRGVIELSKMLGISSYRLSILLHMGICYDEIDRLFIEKCMS
jgi:hypothetical protein